MPASLLDLNPVALGQFVTYNGWTFSTGAKYDFDLQFEYDDARRTVTETVLTLTVVDYVTDADSTGEKLDTMRAVLERPGAALVVKGLGIGTLVLNSPGTEGNRADLNWGPRPQRLRAKHLGGGLGVRITWTCTASVIGCLNSADSFQVKQFNWSARYLVDNGGYTTRTITAKLVIPMTRNGANNPVPPDVVENYLDDLVPVPMAGFERTTERMISAARDTIEFTITDKELAGNPLPEGCVSATASDSRRSLTKGAFVSWAITLSAQYELAKGYGRRKSLDFFTALVADRVQAEKAAHPVCNFFPLEFEIGEPEIYGRQAASFRLTFRMAFTNDDKANGLFIMPSGSLWRPTGDNWNLWSTSLAQAQGPRGNAGLRVHPADDAIVGLCLAAGGVAPAGGQTVDDTDDEDDVGEEEWEAIQESMGLNETQDPLSTWLDYECVIEAEQHDRSHFHIPLPTGPDPNSSGSGSSGSSGTSGGSGDSTGGSAGEAGDFSTGDGGTAGPGQFDDGDAFTIAQQDSPAPVVQYGGTPGYFVRLIGRGLRHSYEVPRPKLLTVAGQSTVEANDPKEGTFWRSGLVSWRGALPMFAAEWNLRYFVARTDGQSPSLLPIQPTPFQQEDMPDR